MTERRPLRDDVRGRPCRDTRGICKAGWLGKGMVLVGDGNDLPETVTKVWRGSNRVETDHAPGGRYLDLWADHEVVYRDGSCLDRQYPRGGGCPALGSASHGQSTENRERHTDADRDRHRSADQR